MKTCRVRMLQSWDQIVVQLERKYKLGFELTWMVVRRLGLKKKPAVAVTRGRSVRCGVEMEARGPRRHCDEDEPPPVRWSQLRLLKNEEAAFPTLLAADSAELTTPPAPRSTFCATPESGPFTASARVG